MVEKSVIEKPKFSINRKFTPYFFVLPVIVVFILVILYPLASNIWMSLFENYLARPTAHAFNNFQNYKELFADKVFWQSTQVTGLYISITVVVRFILGFAIALLLNEKLHLRGLARALIIIPWAVPDIVACLVWIQMFDLQYGIVNYVLTNLHIINGPLDWLSSIPLSLPAAMVVNIWKGTPWVAIMILAGLQSIPEDLYEAADIDGANGFKKLFNVTIPILKPVTITVFLLLVIWSIKDFAIIYILNRGGPVHATEVITIFIYQKAFTDLQMGVAAAGGVILLVASMIFTILYLHFLDTEESVW